MKKLFTLILSIVIPMSCYSQNDRNDFSDSITTFNFQCQGDSIVIHIPNGLVKSQYDYYTEGYLLYILYPDGSLIGILCGGNADLNLQDKRIQQKFYRKEFVKSFWIIYQDVTKERVKTFDYCFNLLVQ